MSDKTKRHTLDFQQYEIDILREALKLAKRKEQSERCKWEWQDGSRMYYYTPNRQVKRIEFILRSIDRQLAQGDQ